MQIGNTSTAFLFQIPELARLKKSIRLAVEGRAYLQTQGMSVDWHFRPYKVAGMTYQNCLHALDLNALSGRCAGVLSKSLQEWELTTLRTEYELKKEIAEEKAKQQAVTLR